MVRVFRLVLILVLTSGAVTVPEGSSVGLSDTFMAQMDSAAGAVERCDRCDPSGPSDTISCESACLVPCGSGGTACILAQMPSVRIATPFVAAVRVAEPLIPLGANPSLDPFPPKLPV